MSRFSQGFETSGTLTGPIIEFIMGASDRARLVEIGGTLKAATATTLGLGYPAAKGVTPTTPVTLLSENPGDSSACGITSALAWATPPTSPAYFYRRASISAGQSFPFLWQWAKGEGLLVLPSTSIVLWLFATGSVTDGWAVFEQ